MGDRECWDWVGGYDLKQGGQGWSQLRWHLNKNPRAVRLLSASLNSPCLSPPQNLVFCLLLGTLLSKTCAWPTTLPPFCLSSKVTFSEKSSLTAKFKWVTPPIFPHRFSLVTFFFRLNFLINAYHHLKWSCSRIYLFHIWCSPSKMLVPCEQRPCCVVSLPVVRGLEKKTVSRHLFGEQMEFAGRRFQQDSLDGVALQSKAVWALAPGPLAGRKGSPCGNWSGLELGDSWCFLAFG